MTTYRFTGPSTTRRLKGTCPGCGKKVSRSRTFERTVNPFNCVGEGENRRPKTWREVDADVQAEAEAWVPDFTCRDCEFTEWLSGLSVEEIESYLRIDTYERDAALRAGKPGKVKSCSDRIEAYEVRLAELQVVSR